MMQEFVQQIKGTIQEFTDGVHTAIPGTITAFDPAKCEAGVNLLGQYNKPDGTKIPYPAAANVPVVFPQVSNQQITIAFPVKPGDGCLVVVAEQALEAWRAGGESNLDLKHDLTNAIAIPGLFRTPNSTMQEAVSEDAIMLVNQGTKVKIKSGEIDIETPKIEIQTEKIHITGEVVIDKELTVREIPFTPHVHKEVSKGADLSGPPKEGGRVNMTDLLLDRSGDLQISADGDLSLTNSTAQAIQLRLRWFLSEWKFGPEYGLPYYEEILVKNASTLRAKQLIREQIMSVDEVRDVTELLATADPAKRTMLVRYTAVTDTGQIREEERFDV